MVRNLVIYDLYKKWTPNPRSKREFALEFNKYFPPKYHRNYVFYEINMNAIDLGVKTSQLLQESKRDKRKNPKYKEHFEAFIRHYDIKPGKVYLESFLLYFLYDKYTYNFCKQSAPLGTYQLFNFMCLYFKHKRVTDSKMEWFAVDESIMMCFSPGQVERVRKAYNEKAKKTGRGKEARDRKITRRQSKILEKKQE